jgi:hypothetical protein
MIGTHCQLTTLSFLPLLGDIQASSCNTTSYRSARKANSLAARKAKLISNMDSLEVIDLLPQSSIPLLFLLHTTITLLTTFPREVFKKTHKPSRK